MKNCIEKGLDWCWDHKREIAVGVGIFAVGYGLGFVAGDRYASTSIGKELFEDLPKIIDRSGELGCKATLMSIDKYDPALYDKVRDLFDEHHVEVADMFYDFHDIKASLDTIDELRKLCGGN